jgi:hypothetical protein
MHTYNKLHIFNCSLGFVLLATGQEIVPTLAQEISLKLAKTFSTNVVSKSIEVKHEETTTF